MLSQNLRQFIQATSGEAIKQLCQPLKNKFNLSFFLFVRDYKNGQRIWLTTHGEWTEYFYTEGLYKLSAFENPFIPYTPGYYLWSTLPGQNVFDMARGFDIDHGITFVSDHAKHYDFFHLGATRDNPQVLNFYLNHRDALERFIAYFKDAAADLIKQIEMNRMTVPFPKRSPQQNIAMPNPEINIDEFLTEIERDRYYLKHDNEDVYLTRRESECLKWCLNGKSSDEIAIIMAISKRTVETHIDNVKEKLRCNKQFQLGYKLAKSGWLYGS